MVPSWSCRSRVATQPQNGKKKRSIANRVATDEDALLETDRRAARAPSHLIVHWQAAQDHAQINPRVKMIDFAHSCHNNQ
jgi:hypothetical protein